MMNVKIQHTHTHIYMSDSPSSSNFQQKVPTHNVQVMSFQLAAPDGHPGTVFICFRSFSLASAGSWAWSKLVASRIFKVGQFEETWTLNNSKVKVVGHPCVHPRSAKGLIFKLGPALSPDSETTWVSFAEIGDPHNLPAPQQHELRVASPCWELRTSRISTPFLWKSTDVTCLGLTQ